MIKKLKEKMRNLHNAKGFTLVELLAVIVILGIIVAIAVPAIGNIIDDAEGTADEAEIALILDAARLADANSEFTSGMTVAELQEAGYLEGDDLPGGTVTIDNSAENTGSRFVYNP